MQSIKEFLSWEEQQKSWNLREEKCTGQDCAQLTQWRAGARGVGF